MIDGEEKLIARAIVGESSAFGRLYDGYQPRIYRFILAKVSHREEAEDLTHQVFLNAWQRIGNFQHRGLPFSAWLYRIARNQVIDHYRAKRTHDSIDLLEDELPSGEHLERSLDSTLSLKQVQEVMTQLTGDQQDVLLMRFVDDLSTKDVAKTLGKSEGAIKLLQYRAIEKLKELLHDYEHE